MDDLLFHILFNSISVISEGGEGDNEKLCAVKLCLWLERFLPQVERGWFKPGTAKSVGQQLAPRYVK